MKMRSVGQIPFPARIIEEHEMKLAKDQKFDESLDLVYLMYPVNLLEPGDKL